jgi:hypothetical protein
MRPAVVVLGFVLGSAAAITFALAGTTIVFVALRSEYPRLEGELRPLLVSVGLFSLLTAAGSSLLWRAQGAPLATRRAGGAVRSPSGRRGVFRLAEAYPRLALALSPDPLP